MTELKVRGLTGSILDVKVDAMSDTIKDVKRRLAQAHPALSPVALCAEGEPVRDQTPVRIALARYAYLVAIPVTQVPQVQPHHVPLDAMQEERVKLQRKAPLHAIAAARDGIGRASKLRKACESAITVNRGPVVTLWAAVVAQRSLSCSWDGALTIGHSIANIMAETKKARLGMAGGDGPAGMHESADVQVVRVFDMDIPCKEHGNELRAVEGLTRKVIDACRVQGNLEKAFGDKLSTVTDVMRKLASSYEDKSQLNEAAYSLYTRFRPPVLHGKAGWGAKGELQLSKILNLVQTR